MNRCLGESSCRIGALAEGWRPRCAQNGHIAQPSGRPVKSGFTLIELLIVIAIIAILAAMLMPVLAAARARAESAACINNLKQMATANIMYSSDYGVFVQPATANTSYGDQSEWMGTLFDYFVKSTNLIVCPVAKTLPPPGSVPNYMGTSANGAANFAYQRTLNSTATLYPGVQAFLSSYQYNGWLYATNNGSGGSGDGSSVETGHGARDPAWFYLKENAMERPVNTPIFMDGPWVDTWPAENDAPAQNLWTGSYSAHANEMGRITILRHGGRAAGGNTIIKISRLPLQGGINMGLADGHAEFTTLPHLWSYNWHKGWATKVAVSIGSPPQP